MNLIDFAKAHNWNMPTSCPVCNSALVLSENHKQFICSNDFCKSRFSGRIHKWVDKLSIKELGYKTIETLIDAGIIDTISSLYKINYSDIENLEGFGKRSAEIIKKEIESHKQVKLAQFIAGYNIEDCGEKVIQKIIDATGMDIIEDFWYANVTDFVCEGVGEKTAQKLYDGLRALEGDMIQTCGYVEILDEEEKETVEGNLSGYSFCFTGASSKPRKELWKMVEENGGIIHESCKKDTDYLVMADVNSTSTKAQKARKNGTKLITEEEFYSLCGN